MPGAVLRINPCFLTRRNKMKKIFLIPAALILLILCSACSKTSITDTWKDPAYTDGPMTSVLVIAVARDRIARRNYEESFVMTLERNHVKAYSSYSESADDPVTREDIINMVKKLDVKYVLITTLIGVDKEEKYHPPQTYVTPRMGLGYYGYYYRAYDVVHEPGYYTTNVKVSLETTVYQAETGKPIWMAQSQTMNPDSAGEVVKSVIPKLVKAMKADGLLPG